VASSRPIRSEAIEAQYRRLLPAQAGNEVTTDLLASDTIIPVINITGAAEGQALRQDLQRASDQSSSAGALVGAGFYDWISTSGFWLIKGVIQIDPSVASNESSTFITSTPSSFVFSTGPALGAGASLVEYVQIPETVVFLKPGQSLRTNQTGTNVVTTLSYRQIADLYGNLSNPNGFTFQ
jgi:hypothetical protein